MWGLSRYRAWRSRNYPEIVSCVVLLVSAASCDRKGQKDDVRLGFRIEPEKKAFGLGEPVRITCVLSNTGNVPAKCRKPCAACVWFGAELPFQGRPGIRFLVFKVGETFGKSESPASYVVLGPNEKIRAKLKLDDRWVCGTMCFGPLGSIFSSVPGRYRLEGFYYRGVVAEEPGGLTSNVVEFDIVAGSGGAEVQQFRDASLYRRLIPAQAGRRVLP